MLKNRIKGILKEKCPRCEKGKVFESKGHMLKVPQMKKQCEICGHVFNRGEPGFFWGATYVSYGVTVTESLIVFAIGQFFFEETFDLRILFFIIPMIIILSPFNYRFSRMLWMYIFTKKSV
jgi:uncharacterized protein (DUF983 family)